MRLKERRESKDLRIVYWLSFLACFPGWLSQWIAWNVCRSWLLWKREGVLKKTVEEYIHDKLEMWSKRKGRPHQVVCYRAWEEKGYWNWRKGGRAIIWRLVAWFPGLPDSLNSLYLQLMSKLFSSFIIKHTVNQYQETCL